MKLNLESFSQTLNQSIDLLGHKMLINHMVKDQKNPLDDMFSALSDATRRAILAQLLEGDQTVSQIAAPFDSSMAMISKHVQILCRAGLVVQQKQGREKICQLEPQALSIASDFLTGFGHFSDESFEALEDSLLTLGLIDE